MITNFSASLAICFLKPTLGPRWMPEASKECCFIKIEDDVKKDISTFPNPGKITFFKKSGKIHTFEKNFKNIFSMSPQGLLTLKISQLKSNFGFFDLSLQLRATYTVRTQVFYPLFLGSPSVEIFVFVSFWPNFLNFSKNVGHFLSFP